MAPKLHLSNVQISLDTFRHKPEIGLLCNHPNKGFISFRFLERKDHLFPPTYSKQTLVSSLQLIQPKPMLIAFNRPPIRPPISNPYFNFNPLVFSKSLPMSSNRIKQLSMFSGHNHNPNLVFCRLVRCGLITNHVGLQKHVYWLQ